ncbi:trigger factor [Gemmatimonas groenlandica]|uniref:Trigger factor n=1 Tax=Gemmatimonas groenlandica TaxID=2732249 RepID=A0A6M4IKR5_9BACT|nr:trigger factor [Gemmatimonas groenlandica]QJR34459.1 trigger factor [Gemmatimonas groenlandica]
MTITITPTESAGVSRRMQISVPADTVASYEEKAARKYATQARIPGFRPGKAPAAMVRKRYAAEVRQEAIELAMNDAFREAVEREGLKLAAQPHVHDLKAEPGQPLEFELHCEVRPELALEKLEGFTVTRRDSIVTDDLIEEQIEKIREQKADWAPVEDKPAPGDMVTVMLSTADADGSLPEGKEYRLVLGGGQAIAGIEELIMETAPGGTTERQVRWPEDFPDESQRGSTKLVRVVLTDVKRKSLPALDDAFARELGDFDTVQILRDAVRTDMGEHSKREADAEVRGQIIDQIVEANPFDVPKAWVMQLVDGYMQMYGVPEAEKQRFTQEFIPMAERQVRRDLIIDTIAERESLTASASAVDARIEELAKARNVDPGQVYAQLQKSGRLQEIERELTEDRVFGWLLEKNPVTTA